MPQMLSGLLYIQNMQVVNHTDLLDNLLARVISRWRTSGMGMGAPKYPYL